MNVDHRFTQTQKQYAADEADPGDHAHHDEKARAAERPVWGHQRGKQCGLACARSLGGVALAHASIIPA